MYCSLQGSLLALCPWLHTSVAKQIYLCTMDHGLSGISVLILTRWTMSLKKGSSFELRKVRTKFQSGCMFERSRVLIQEDEDFFQTLSSQ